MQPRILPARPGGSRRERGAERRPVAGRAVDLQERHLALCRGRVLAQHVNHLARKNDPNRR